MKRSRRRKLSELEGVCLGIVRKSQPCTAYRVRCALKEAPSSHWQASAGSVYPLLARLEEEGLIVATSDKDDGRGRKLLRVNAAGKRLLEKWILAGTDHELIASVTDPIRSRAFFLDALNAERRVEFIEDLIVQLESYLLETRAHLETRAEADDPYEHLGALGAVRITEARLDWLRTMRGRLPK